jgi:hypothetical protein
MTISSYKKRKQSVKAITSIDLVHLRLGWRSSLEEERVMLGGRKGLSPSCSYDEKIIT